MVQRDEESLLPVIEANCGADYHCTVKMLRSTVTCAKNSTKIKGCTRYSQYHYLSAYYYYIVILITNASI